MNNVSKFAFDESAEAEDRKRWLDARTMIYTKTPDAIRAWVLNQEEGEYKTDMRRRLNVIKNNLPKRRGKK